MELITDRQPIFQETKAFQRDDITFVSTVAHRQPSWTSHPAPVIPHKRKSVDSSDGASTSSHKDFFKSIGGNRDSTPSSASNKKGVRKNAKGRRYSTPSSSGNDKAAATSSFSVVVPSPKEILQKASGPVGLSETFFPTKVPEYEKTAKRSYPEANLGARSVAPLLSSSSRPVQKSLEYQTRYSRERLLNSIDSISGPRITLSVDDEKLAMLSTSFLFVNNYALRNGVTPVEDEFNAGCDCPGRCDPETCGCLVQELESDKLIVPYQRKDDKLVLRPDFLKGSSMIYECSYRCSCKGNCWNHVVQLGRRVRLEIFDTGDRGLGRFTSCSFPHLLLFTYTLDLGLRSPDPILAGQFIDRYLGEVITKADAEAREVTDQEGQSYLFSLDFIKDDEMNWVIDGQKLGSATRFINHSCNPNCKIIPVSTDNHGDDRLYYLAFFARRDIPAGTELTFDYNPSWDGSRVNDPDAVQCKCGEKRCRGQLWPNARKTQNSG